MNVVGASFVEPSSPLVTQLRNELGDVTTFGVRGATVARWLSSFVSAVPPQSNAPCLVFEMGGNGAPTASQVRNAHAVLRNHATDVRWVLPPEWPVAGDTKARRDATRAAILAAHVPVVRHGWKPLPGDLAGDAQHLRPVAYRAFASAVVANLRSEKNFPWVGVGTAIVCATLVAIAVVV
jgi:hypothetical protein